MRIVFALMESYNAAEKMMIMTMMMMMIALSVKVAATVDVMTTKMTETMGTVGFKVGRLRMVRAFVLVATHVVAAEERSPVRRGPVQERGSALEVAQEKISMAPCAVRVRSHSPIVVLQSVLVSMILTSLVGLVTIEIHVRGFPAPMALSASLGIQDASSEEENVTMWTTFDCVLTRQRSPATMSRLFPLQFRVPLPFQVSLPFQVPLLFQVPLQMI
jgi:uncharacterized membrane protein (DUF485 family)